MLPRRAILSTAMLGACVAPPPRPDPLPLSPEALLVAAESWHLDLCLPAVAVRAGPLAPFGGAAPLAQGFAIGFGLESWMRAARPGSGEALGAIAGGPAVLSIRALPGAMPPGAEDSVSLRLPAGGLAAIARFILSDLAAPPAPAPAGGGWLLMPATRRYSLGFTCNTWVMAALAATGLPVPVSGIRFRGEAMEALRAEAARQSLQG
jgi:hypothetical protein